MNGLQSVGRAVVLGGLVSVDSELYHPSMNGMLCLMCMGSV